MKKICRNLLFVCCMFLLCSCSAQNRAAQDITETETANVPPKEDSLTETANVPQDYENLVFTTHLQPEYATQFLIEESGEYLRIQIAGTKQYLIVPEGSEIPAHLPKNMTVLKKPFYKTYLSASSVFDLLRRLECLNEVRFSGIKRQDLFIEEANKKMQTGDMLYAGKYNAPDYELLLSEQCNLAIESTMIYHNPETKEKLEELQIPVFVERSSYESHPLGRLEWIKVYGVLFDKEEQAEQFFDEEKNHILPILSQEKNGCKAAFFHVNSNGTITVRKPGDYIAKMIALAGGEYVFDDLFVEEENALSTVNIQVEDFYLYAKDADVLIYNSTIEGELFSLKDFLSLNEVFSDLKAVKENRVYCTGKNFFQETTGVGTFVEDLNTIFLDSKETLHYMWRLE